MSDNNEVLEQDNIASVYLEFVKTNGRLPNSTDFHKNSISIKKIRHHFGNMTNLHNFISENYLDEISDYIITDKNVFTHLKFKELNDLIKNKKRFVISTVVSGKKIHIGFYETIKKYCEENDAVLILLPCLDSASMKRTTNETWNFDPLLKEDFFAFQNVKLNENIFLSAIRLSAKQIKPTTGLNRIGQRNGSYIFASPKQFLEYVVNSPDNDKLPHAIMTPGALTENDYKSDRYMSERTSYIAENDHVIGAIIVEIKDERLFHFRQIQCNEDGSFIDLCRLYEPSGKITTIPADIVLGDWHSGKTDPLVVDVIKDMASQLYLRDVIVHDFFDGTSISHHDLNFPLKLAKKAMDNKSSLDDEIENGANELNFLLSNFSKVFMVKGNHDEFLERYLTKGTYVQDPTNHYTSLKLAIQLLEGKNPLRHAYESTGLISDPSRIVWLERDQSYKIGGVECGSHGDLGLNGSRGSLLGIERALGDCIIGHAHGAAILRGVWRVGTSTHLKLDYNRGPSSWTQTHCLIYSNGSRQLINIIDGEWRL